MTDDSNIEFKLYHVFKGSLMPSHNFMGELHVVGSFLELGLYKRSFQFTSKGELLLLKKEKEKGKRRRHIQATTLCLCISQTCIFI